MDMEVGAGVGHTHPPSHAPPGKYDTAHRCSERARNEHTWPPGTLSALYELD
jgi:hypothetical protein